MVVDWASPIWCYKFISIPTVYHIQGFIIVLFILMCFPLPKTFKFLLRNARKLKDRGIFIYDDFSKEAIELRKTLWEHVLEYCHPKEICLLKLLKHCCHVR